jgi:DNA-binding MarR family transcriptional regulator
LLPIQISRQFNVNENLPWKTIYLPEKRYFLLSALDRIVADCRRVYESGTRVSRWPQIKETGRMPRKKTDTKIGNAEDIATSWARERPDLDPLDYLLPIYLIRIGRIVERAGDHKWKRTLGISASELRVLLALRRAGGEYSRRPTDLFKALLVTSGAMTKTIDRLERLKLVKRRPDPDDKGGFLIFLTSKGKGIADTAMSEIADASVVSKSRLTLSRQERKLLIKLCEHVLQDFEKDGEALSSFA